MFGILYSITPWVIDVWDCHGVLKMRDWGVGYGCKPELPRGLEWLNIGYFDVPIRSEERHLWDERLKRRVNGILSGILEENGGAINWSGIYPVYEYQLDKIYEAVIKYHKQEPRRINLSILFES